MRAAVLYNPNAGRGRGERVAQGIRTMLEGRRCTVNMLATAKEPPDAFRARVGEALAGADFLVVAGGDGTLHHTLPALAGSGVPVYHLAMGTENLFARQFGMDRWPETLEAAIDKWQITDVDLGMLNVAGVPRPFVLMCSLGPDASVIRSLDEARRGPISHLSYLKPIASELMNPWLPRLSIDIDGERIVTDQRGMLVIANSRQYAIRIDPAHSASMTDGLLDVVFVPSTGRWSLFAAFTRFRIRNHGAGVIYKQGHAVRVHANDPHPALQIDGESHKVAPGPLDLNITIHPKALKVLTP